MKHQFVRMSVYASAMVLTLALSGSTAFAFHCYNASRSDQGNASAAKAPALATPGDLLVAFCGVDPADVEGILDELEDEGFETDILINAHAIMAGGLQGKDQGEELLDNDKGIDHLGGDFFAALGELADCPEE